MHDAAPDRSRAGAARIRVALWAPLPPPVGGISRWVGRYLDAAPRHGIDARVLDVSPRVSSVDERSRLELGRLRVAGRALAALRGELAGRPPDVAHVTSSLFWATPRDALALRLCRRRGVPALLNLRSSSQLIAWREGLGPLRRRLLDRALREARVVVVLARELEAYLRAELPGLDVRRIGNMVAPAERAPDALRDRALPPRRAPCRILFVGHRMPLKGLGELARAVLALPRCELVVVGGRGGGAIDAEAERRMEAALERLREAGRLRERGELPPEQLADAYREADVFALPTHREGFPNTLLEAMATGLPCVATPVGAVPEMLEGGAGEVVPVGDEAALRKVLEALAADPERRRRLGARAARRVAERYEVDAVMRAYRALYEEMLRAEDAGVRGPAAPRPRRRAATTSR